MGKHGNSFRLRACLLAAAMFLSLLSPMAPEARGAEVAVTGSVSATVRLDYDQSLAELERREVRAELWQGGTYLAPPIWPRPGP